MSVSSAAIAVRLKSSPVSAKNPTVLVTSRISVAIAPTANGHSKRTQM